MVKKIIGFKIDPKKFNDAFGGNVIRIHDDYTHIENDNIELVYSNSLRQSYKVCITPKQFSECGIKLIYNNE